MVAPFVMVVAVVAKFPPGISAGRREGRANWRHERHRWGREGREQPPNGNVSGGKRGVCHRPPRSVPPPAIVGPWLAAGRVLAAI